VNPAVYKIRFSAPGAPRPVRELVSGHEQFFAENLDGLTEVRP
jgi:hypothetical protein